MVTEAVRDKRAPPADPPDDARAYLRDLVRTLTRFGDASVVAAAMSTRGEEGRTGLRDTMSPWFDTAVARFERAVARGELSSEFPARTTAHSGVGYALYRIVFLEEEITEAGLTSLVGPLPLTNQ